MVVLQRDVSPLNRPSSSTGPRSRHGIHMGFAHWARSGFWKSQSSIPGRLLNHSYSVMSRLTLAAYTGACCVARGLFTTPLHIRPFGSRRRHHTRRTPARTPPPGQN